MSDVAPTVLVIEDERQMRRFLKASLEANDYHCVEAVTAREGLAQATGRNPDVILLDLGLPDLDGVELTRRLREWSRTPIIVISARGREQDKIAALDAGVDDYLTKPFGIGELLATLVRHAGKVVTHRQLLKEAWGPNAVEQTHYVRVYMTQLRHKLEDEPSRPRYLLTESGVGYRLKTE